MKKCFPVFLIICFMMSVTAANAQFTKDIEGKPYLDKSYTEVEGSPYLASGWAAGTVILSNNRSITAKIKYDLMRDELLFQSPGDTSALVFSDPVKSFTLGVASINESDQTPVLFSNGYPAVDGYTTISYYQVIADGKARLLKRYEKKIEVSKAFNSATSTQKFVLKTAYYTCINNQMVKIRPNAKSISAALSDKSSELQTYLKTNNINYKSDASLAKLFTYYNSL